MMLFWVGGSVRYWVRVGIKFRLGLTLSLKLTQAIPNLNLTYFGVRPGTLDVITTGEKMQKNTYGSNMSSKSRAGR